MVFSIPFHFYPKSVTLIGLVPLSIALSGYSQTPASSAVPDHAAPSTSGSPLQASECSPGDTTPRPLNSTIEAKVPGGLDSAHLKPGKEVWVKVVNEYDFPGCTLDADSILYGRIISTTSSRNPDAAELSVIFDHGDCTGHGKKKLSLRVIGLMAPPDESRKMHEVIPVEVAGGAKQVGGSGNGRDAVTATNGYDDSLNPGGAPHTIHPGIVVNMPRVKLEPQGGPGCSARITSASRSVQLGPGSELILTMSIVPE